MFPCDSLRAWISTLPGKSDSGCGLLASTLSAHIGTFSFPWELPESLSFASLCSFAALSSSDPGKRADVSAAVFSNHIHLLALGSSAGTGDILSTFFASSCSIATLIRRTQSGVSKMSFFDVQLNRLQQGGHRVIVGCAPSLIWWDNFDSRCAEGGKWAAKI